MRDRRIRFHRYLRTWAWACGLALLGIGIGNAFMDPYRMFGSPDIAGVNAVKTEVVKHDRAAKSQMLLRAAPDALILGNSRSLNGIPTWHPAWTGYTVFNGALTAGRIAEALDILRLAHAHRPIRRVLLNIDELNYRPGVDPTVGANANRFRDDFRGDWARLADRATALFTDRAVRASVRTWNASREQMMESDFAVVRQDGSIEEELFYRAIASRGGAREAFRRVEAAARTHKGDGRHRPAVSDAESILLEFLRFGRRHGIEISIYFPPIHVRSLAEKQFNGSLDELFEVRRSVTDVVMREAAESGQSPAKVLDFLALNSSTTEPIPPEGDRITRMTWFFEGSHFTQTLGNCILDAVYPREGTALVDPSGCPSSGPFESIQREASLIDLLRQWSAYQPTEVREISFTHPR